MKKINMQIDFSVPDWCQFVFWTGEGMYDFVASDKPPVNDGTGLLCVYPGARRATPRWSVLKAMAKDGGLHAKH